MILETAKRPIQIDYVKCPNWINFLALTWLLFEDMLKLIAPRLVRYQVLALVQYDRGVKVATKEIETYSWVWSIGQAFCCFYLVLLGIATLEGVLKWLQ